MTDEATRRLRELESRARELTRLHLEVLIRMVCDRGWKSDGPSLAGIWELLPDEPREITIEEILAVLDEIGTAPEDYFFEVSREITKRELQETKREIDEMFARLQAARPPWWGSERGAVDGPVAE